MVLPGGITDQHHYICITVAMSFNIAQQKAPKLESEVTNVHGAFCKRCKATTATAINQGNPVRAFDSIDIFSTDLWLQSPLAMGGFATTLLGVSLTFLSCRGVNNEAVHVGNLCFVAGIGLLISAQWEMRVGNTFAYTVFSAFGEYYKDFYGYRDWNADRGCIGLFYSGYGATMIPAFGVVDAYGGYTSEYYNAMGFFILGNQSACLRSD